MERLFESLAENVSEACYNDIIALVENLFSTFNREHEKENEKIRDIANKIKDDNERVKFLNNAHANRKYKYELGDKILKLRDDAAKQAGEDAEKRGATISDRIKLFDTWKDRYKSKNEVGEKKTRLRHAEYQNN